MNRIKIGVRLESLGLPFRRALAEAGKMGVTGVELDAVGDFSPQQLSETGRRELRFLLRSHNVELTALGCPLRRALGEERDLQQRLEHVRQVMTLSYDLGPRIVILQPGKVPDPADLAETPSPGNSASSPAAAEKSAGGLLLGTAETLALGLAGGSDLGLTAERIQERKKAQWMTEAFRDLGAHGDRTGTVLALETGLETGAALNAYLDRFDSGALRVNLDPANLLLHGFAPLASMRALNRKIVHVHAHDAREASSSRAAQEVPLGHGDIDWLMFLAVLEEIEYSGYLVVEREMGENRVADVSGGVAFLQRLLP